MAIFYSAAQAGFFDDAIHAQLPADAVALSVAEHQSLLTAQSQGMVITADSEGRPVAVEPPSPTEAQLLANMRQERDRLLRACDFTQVSDAPLTEAEREEWRVYRQALRDLPEITTDPAMVAWPATPA